MGQDNLVSQFGAERGDKGRLILLGFLIAGVCLYDRCRHRAVSSYTLVRKEDLQVLCTQTTCRKSVILETKFSEGGAQGRGLVFI